MLDRRRFIQSTAAVAGGLAVAGPFQGLLGLARGAAATPLGRQSSLGDLEDVADLRDGVVRLALPAGYTYRSFGLAGAQLADGVICPGNHDGMGAFAAPDGTVRLVRSHEVRGHGEALGCDRRAYDANALAGATTLAVDPHSRECLSGWLSLGGTSVNCVGGVMPWGTWISAEETVNGPDLGVDFTGTDGPDSLQPHGYLFEVDPCWGPGEYAAAVPVRSAGRFAHECAVFDLTTGHLFQTEDNFEGPSGIYRYLPPEDPMVTRRLCDGGSLEQLRVVDSPDIELGLPQRPGASYSVDWVPIAEPDWDLGPGIADNDVGIAEVARQGFEQGGAQFARPEGMWAHDGLVYFACTRGGGEGLTGNPLGEYGNGFGQIWVLDPQRSELDLIFESPGPDVMDMPDNITISPTGQLLVCEDGTDDQYLRYLTTDGVLSDFALNRVKGIENAEFAGAVFSPDGRTLFVNVQHGYGLTFAIWRLDGAVLT